MYLAVIGPGLVGKAVLEQIKWYQLGGKSYPPLNVLGICSSRKRMHGTLQHPIDLQEWENVYCGGKGSNNSHYQVEDSGDLDLFVAELYHLCNGHQATLCIVDCTSSQEVAEKYSEWLRKGMHIVTPNKKAFSSSQQYYDLLQETTRKKPRGYPMLMHESTCGAGLPVLSTLKDLVYHSGDEVEKIEGILSGTLSYLFNQFSTSAAGGGGGGSSGKKQKFSDIVKTAKELGYTEPDPRDDLNGVDVARKVTILARLAGLKMELNDVSVENMVPQELRTVSSSEEFMQKLSQFDEEFDRMNQEAMKQHCVLRMDERCKVVIKKYPFDHPFAQLKGSDNIIAFTTKRFQQPLIIQGAGAGAQVTAHGIMSDLVKIADCVHFHAHQVFATLKGYAEDPVRIYTSMIAYQGIMNDPLLLSVYVVSASTLLCYVLGFATRNYSWVDRWWSVVPVVYTGIFAFAAGATKTVATDLRTLIVFVLILLWGLRLTYNFQRKGGYSLSTEDYRWAYVKSWFPSVVLWEVFHLLFICAYQNILLWLITLPVYVCSKYRTELTVTDYLLALLQFTLLLGETVADQQQWNFHLKKAQQKNKKGSAADVKQGFLTEGLWKYSRHPNFFCEISQWFVVYAFSVSATKSPLNYTIIGAILLLLLFQGSTWLTEKISSEKYPMYKNYQQTTSRLIPWFPSNQQSTQKKNK